MHFFALLLVLKIDFADVYVLGLQGAFECDGIENNIPLTCYPLNLLLHHFDIYDPLGWIWICLYDN